MEHALVRRDVRMLHDPMRSQSRAMTVGIVLAALALAGCGILALLRPQDKVGDARIIVGKESGTLFVRIDEAFHPVFNLASARLILGEAAAPVVVKESELARFPRGPWVGILGASPALTATRQEDGSAWAVCDSVNSADSATTATTTVVVGALDLGDRMAPLDPDEAVLVTRGDTYYLLHGGVRAEVDLSSAAVARAYGLEDATARPISPGLLDAIPEAEAITAPRIPGAGARPDFDLPEVRVGEVVQVQNSGGTQYYVVHRAGVAKVGEAVADLVRYADSQGRASIRSIAPDTIADAPLVEVSAFVGYPQERPNLVANTMVTCLRWHAPQDGAAGTRQLLVGHGLPVADTSRIAVLANADQGGDAVDNVHISPGSGYFVHSAGADPAAGRRGALFYVADTGVRYGIVSAEEAQVLGMPETSVPAPWAILRLLAAGPALARADALVAHDAVAPSADPGPVASGR